MYSAVTLSIFMCINNRIAKSRDPNRIRFKGCWRIMLTWQNIKQFESQIHVIAVRRLLCRVFISWSWQLQMMSDTIINLSVRTIRPDMTAKKLYGEGKIWRGSLLLRRHQPCFSPSSHVRWGRPRRCEFFLMLRQVEREKLIKREGKRNGW